MANLQLAVKGEYFHAMMRGEKTEEYRLVNAYWGRRIFGRDYERLIITLGYQKIAIPVAALISRMTGLKSKPLLTRILALSQ